MKGYSLRHVDSRLIERSELAAVGDAVLSAATGDPIVDRMFADLQQKSFINERDLATVIKRVYYLGMLEGTRRTADDPRIVAFTRKKEKTRTKNAFTKTVPRVSR